MKRMPAAWILLLCLSAAPPALAQTTQPDDGPTAAALAHYARGEYGEVVKLLDPVNAAGRANIQQRLLLGRALLHLKRDADAGGVLTAVLNEDPDNPEANLLLGEQQLRLGQPKQAAGYLEKAHKGKADARTAAMLGMTWFQLGETSKAKPLLEEALAQDVRNPETSLTLGCIYLARGAGAQAERYLLMAREAGLDNVELHNGLGLAYLLQRKYVGPISEKRIARAARPGEIVDEQVVLRKSVDRPDHYLVTTQYCALYEGIRLPPLLAKADDAEQRGPKAKLADANYMLAAGWLAAGEPAMAEQYRAQLPGNDPRGIDLKAQLALVNGNFPLLEETVAQALQSKTFDAQTAADFYYRGGLLLRASGKHVEAKRLLVQADELTPTSAKVLRALAGLARATGDTKAGVAYLTRLIELYPDASDINELRNTLKVLTEKEGA